MAIPFLPFGKNNIKSSLAKWSTSGSAIRSFIIQTARRRPFSNTITTISTRISPIWIFGIRVTEKCPSTTFFLLDDERNILLGAVSIRHDLNDHLLQYAGHIGDGIRPSERRKGYATKMIGLALDECRKLGLERVLMVCEKDNITSAKSIVRNGGVLENEVADENGVVSQRYWIELR